MIENRKDCHECDTPVCVYKADIPNLHECNSSVGMVVCG